MRLILDHSMNIAVASLMSETDDQPGRSRASEYPRPPLLDCGGWLPDPRQR